MRTQSKLLPAIALIASVLGCGGCSSGGQQIETKKIAPPASPTFAEVLRLTKEHERTVDDGWWFSQYPRIFKSGYAEAAPEIKALFACDYAAMLKDSKQDLVRDWNSYVTYSKRTEFANHWWQTHDTKGLFKSLNKKMHVVWLHEALLDGSELWWRAFEIKNAESLQSPTALAHDEEQKKVFQYLDREGHPRSLSDLVASDGTTK